MRRGSITYTTELCKPKVCVMSMLLPEPRRGPLGFHAASYKAAFGIIYFFFLHVQKAGAIDRAVAP